MRVRNGLHTRQGFYLNERGGTIPSFIVYLIGTKTSAYSARRATTLFAGIHCERLHWRNDGPEVVVHEPLEELFELFAKIHPGRFNRDRINVALPGGQLLYCLRLSVEKGQQEVVIGLKLVRRRQGFNALPCVFE